MRRRHITAAAALLLAASASPAAAPWPAYTPVAVADQTGTGYAELLLPNATPGAARHAITDYAAGIDAAAHDLYFLKVQTTVGADRYVCRARWYRDPESWEQHATGTAPSGAWPRLTVTCP